MESPSSLQQPMRSLAASLLIPQGSVRTRIPEPIRPVTSLPKERKFRCDVPQCLSQYARKGGLARHRREKHSDEEYLCPFPSCSWHPKGCGFKRIDHLASHLLRQGRPFWHPRALSRLDARYIAIDYNDSLVGQSQLSFMNDICENSESERVVLHWGGQRELTKYTDRLHGSNCPQAGCTAFFLLGQGSFAGDARDQLMWNHLMQEHSFSRKQTEQLLDELRHMRQSGHKPASELGSEEGLQRREA